MEGFTRQFKIFKTIWNIVVIMNHAMFRRPTIVCITCYNICVKKLKKIFQTKHFYYIWHYYSSITLVIVPAIISTIKCIRSFWESYRTKSQLLLLRDITTAAGATYNNLIAAILMLANSNTNGKGSSCNYKIACNKNHSNNQWRCH